MQAFVLVLTLAAPAVSQESAGRPVFKEPPVDGTVGGNIGCISTRHVEQDGVLRQVNRDLPPRYVPKEQRVSGSATETVTRPALRTLLHLSIRTSGESVPVVAERLHAARASLTAVIEDAGHQPLSVDLLDVRIAPQPRRPGGPVAGEVRLAVLLPGELDRQAALAIAAAAPSTSLERMAFDYPVPEAVAENLRPALERRALRDAADRAATEGAVLAELLGSELRFADRQITSISSASGDLTVTAVMTYRMAPNPVADAKDGE